MDNREQLLNEMKFRFDINGMKTVMFDLGYDTDEFPGAKTQMFESFLDQVIEDGRMGDMIWAMKNHNHAFGVSLL